MLWQVEWASKNRFPPFHSTIIGVECLFEFKSLLTCCFTPFKRFLGGPLKFAFSGGLVGFEEANCAVFGQKTHRSLLLHEIPSASHCRQLFQCRNCEIRGPSPTACWRDTGMKSLSQQQHRHPSPSPTSANSGICQDPTMGHWPWHQQLDVQVHLWRSPNVPDVSSLQNPPSSQFRYTTASWLNPCGFPGAAVQSVPFLTNKQPVYALEIGRNGNRSRQKARHFFEQLGCSFQGG